MPPVTPLHYTLHIQPDLQAFQFSGMVRIDLHASTPVSRVSLDARELEIFTCTLLHQDAWQDCQFELEEHAQKLHINLPFPIQGEFSLKLSFSGEINRQYAGFYRSSYHQDSQERWIASTQFEARDARRAFPCFDEPALKATFDIEIILPASLTAISNAPLSQEDLLEGGQKRMRFARTPPLSTYLVFFAVGEFEFIQDDSAQPLVRVAATPGKAEYGRFSLQMARQALQFGQEYTGIRYPLAKCDYIAVPDSMGAMENFGAIRHSEEDLLVHPGTTPRVRAILTAKIVAHEAIHMWFGDMVSPAAWKYLWLNEAFATYFTYVIPHTLHPEWQVGEQFFQERMLTGLERDSLDGSIPIDLPGMDDPDADPAPTPSTAPIVYNKAAAVLRMLNAHLGEATFRSAIRAYLERYLHSAATAEQFWESVEVASGLPLSGFARCWTRQAGYPLVSVEPAPGGLQLTQQRFTYNPGTAAQATWTIPLQVLIFLDDGSQSLEKITFDSPSMHLPLPAGTLAYHLNAGFSGFYRVKHLPANLEKLGSLACQQALSDIDCLSVLSDQFALLRAGQVTLEDHLAFIERFFLMEARPLVLVELASQLAYIFRVVVSHREHVLRFGIPLLERSLDAIGLMPGQQESALVNELRTTLLQLGLLLGSHRVLDFGKAQFQALLDGVPVPGDLLPPVLKLAAATHPHACPWLTARAADPGLSELERGMALEALGNSLQATDLQSALSFNLEAPPPSLRRKLWVEAARNPACSAWLWEWIRQHATSLQSLPLAHLPGVLVTLVPLACTGQRVEAEQVLGELCQQHPTLADSIRMAIELLAVNERMALL